MIVAIGALAFVQDGWWNGDWEYRRILTIRNRLGASLKEGHPVSIRLSPGFLGLDRKARQDFADFRVVRGGKPVPHDLTKAEGEGDDYMLSFRLAADIESKSFDKYAVYYGNSSAAPAERAQVMELVVGFDSDKDLRSFDVDPAVKASVKEGRAQLSSDKGTLRVRNLSGLTTFRFKSTFSFRSEDPKGGGVFLFRMRAKPSGKPDAGVAKKVEELIEKLGDDNYRVREDATAALVEVGKDALPMVEKAFKETRDPEVRWRCEFAIQEIAKRSPLPEIVVQYTFLPGGMVQLRTVVGGKAAESAFRAAGGDISLEIIRMEKHGSVRISTPAGAVANIGVLNEEIDEVSLELARVQGGTVALDTVTVERYLSDQGKPSFEIDVEHKKP
ncbi:MAG TPA: HEAT repeat domain-containing protein [Planctomycetota bacterium]|nr:HEAT repeat domain-containing protein [Planctomycetota bacterium]